MGLDRVQLQKVRTIGHAETKTIDPDKPQTQQRLHVYSGWLEVSMQSEDIFRKQVASFVPISPGVIQTVPNVDPLLGGIATASPASVALDESETIFAVDGASVALEPQKTPLPGVVGLPSCLTLRIDLAIQKGSLLVITYQITALWSDVVIKTPTLPGVTFPTGEGSD